MIRVGVNGVGRIGRAFWRIARGSRDVRIVAVNDLCSANTLQYLLRHDSTRPPVPARLGTDGVSLDLDGEPVAIWSEPRPDLVPWHTVGVDVLVDATPRPSTVSARACVENGVRRVVIASPV